MEFLIGLKRKDPKKLKGEIQHDIKEFLGGISRMTIQKRVYLLPVMSLNLGAPLSIGGVQIAELTTQFLQVASGQYGVGFSFPPETPADTVQKLVTEDGTPTFALVEVEAVDPGRGAQLAAMKADSSLNVLRTFVDLSGGSPAFVLRSDFASSLVTHVRHLDVARKSLSTEAAVLNLVASVPSLTAAQVAALAPRMGTIDQLMLKPAEDLTDLESSVLDAVYWFGRGVREHDLTLKYLLYFIALESLLIPNYQRAKSATLARNISGILYDKAPSRERNEVEELALALADTRNRIVHSGLKTVPVEHLNQLEHWAQNIILAIQKQTKYQELDDLIDAEYPHARGKSTLLGRLITRLGF